LHISSLSPPLAKASAEQYYSAEAAISTSSQRYQLIKLRSTHE
jgi:hypothetical protein